MIVANSFAPDQIVPMLARLNRGEAVSFSHDAAGPLAFTIAKAGREFVVRDPRGIALASVSTFAEAWRNRPRPEAATAVACGPATDAKACAHDFQGWRAFEDGNGGEAVCTRCGLGAMAHTLRTGP